MACSNRSAAARRREASSLIISLESTSELESSPVGDPLERSAVCGSRPSIDSRLGPEISPAGQPESPLAEIGLSARNGEDSLAASPGPGNREAGSARASPSFCSRASNASNPWPGEA